VSYTHEQRVNNAKKLLRAEGYVVIPRERHVVLTVDRAVSVDLLEMLKDDKGFLEHCFDAVGSQIGREMARRGAITKEDLGRDGSPWAIQRWRYQAGIILPKDK
jgi:hypothetical protein